MRILWHGIGPWHKTGYGVQTALFTPRLAALGHEVAIAWMGVKGTDDIPAKAHPEAREALATGRWRGLPVCGPGDSEFGLPRPAEIRAAFGGHNPDLVIVLKDAWVLDPAGYQPWPTLHWCAFDTEPLGLPDRQFFAQSGATPVAVSSWGLAQLRAAGLDPAGYVPHGVDLSLFRPAAGRKALRAEMGLPPDAFIAGIVGSNSGQLTRKAWGEQFAGFARFHAKHPDSLLLVHAIKKTSDGIDLEALALRRGILPAVRFGKGLTQQGNATPGQMVDWYQCLDVLMNATQGEGFGVPIIEAQACGVPVIATDCSAMTEKITPGTGWLVHGQQWWHPWHLADWTTPSIPGIAAALGKAYRQARHPELCVAAALEYDVDEVTRRYWKPLLDSWRDRPRERAVLTSDTRRDLPPARARSLAVLVPSRGRPVNVARLVKAVKNTTYGDVTVIFGFDDDDPQLAENLAAADGAHVVTGPRTGLAGWTNRLAGEWVAKVDALASFGDDHEPVTPGWDTALLKALGGGGIAYPNDLIRDDIPEAVVISSGIVAGLGWMCLPGLHHWYVDNVWADLGKGAGCLAYLPDVIVRHDRHRPPDATDLDAWPKVKADEATWRKWRAGQMDADVATVYMAIREGLT